MLEVDNTYICHWSKLIDRKSKLLDNLTINNIDKFEFVENFDVANFDVSTITKKYPNIFNSIPSGRNMKLSEISLILKHLWIIEDAYDNNYDSILILEDDALLVFDFINSYNNYIKQLPANWDILWVGTCCNLNANYKENTNVYRASGSRCTHAFSMSKSCINKIKDNIFNVNNPIDFYYNTLIEELNLNNYWAEPALAYQNTEFSTSLIV